MDGVKIDYKKILEIVLIGIGCYWALNNFQIILDIFNSILAVIMPFLLGIMIAFILNVLMIRIEKILSRFILDKKYTSFKRVISIIVIVDCYWGNWNNYYFNYSRINKCDKSNR